MICMHPTLFTLASASSWVLISKAFVWQVCNVCRTATTQSFASITCLWSYLLCFLGFSKEEISLQIWYQKMDGPLWLAPLWNRVFSRPLLVVLTDCSGHMLHQLEKWTEFSPVELSLETVLCHCGPRCHVAYRAASPSLHLSLSLALCSATIHEF